MEINDKPSTSTGGTQASEIFCVDFQFVNLVKYVKRLKEPLRDQLSKILRPLFFYVYKDLLSRRKIDDAHLFALHDYKYLHGIGDHKRLNKELLSKIETEYEFSQTKYFKKFCENTATYDFSDEALEHLLDYLKGRRYRGLLSIILFNFKLLGDSGDRIQALEAEMFEASDEEDSDIEIFLDNFNYSLEENTRKSCFYSVHCKNQNICAVDIDQNNKFLACGFENAAIHLWNLNIDDFNYAENNELKLGLIVPRDFSSSSKRSKSCRGSDILLRGHKGSVYGVKFTSQRDMLLSCSEDCTVKAWSLNGFKILSSWGDQKYPLWDIAVSSNTEFFATACRFLADVWSFERPHPVLSFSGHTADVDCVRIHSNSRYFATASADKTIKLWHIGQKKHLREFNARTFISSIEFSPNGKHIISADDFGSIKIWDIGSEKMIKDMQNVHSGRITSVSYNSSNTLLASGSFDESLKIWDVSDTVDFTDEGRENLDFRNSTTLVESQVINSELQYVSFRNSNLILAVSTPKQPEFEDIAQYL